MEAAKLANSVSCAGKSRIEVLWDEMDRIMDKLMSDGEANQEPEGGYDIPTPTGHADIAFAPDDIAQFREDCKSWGEERGQAQGIAYALAIMLDPYNVNVPAIKDEAYHRWEDRQDDDQD